MRRSVKSPDTMSMRAIESVQWLTMRSKYRGEGSEDEEDDCVFTPGYR